MSDSLSKQIISVLQEVLPTGRGVIPLHEPDLGGNVSSYVQECVESGWVSSVGAFVDRFEKDLCEYTGAKHAVVTVNGTAALHLALILAGVKTGDEVLMPALSFVATANAVSYCGAVPHFVESHVETLGIDVEKLAEHLSSISEKRSDGLYNRETGRPIRAVVPMHVFGHPVAMPQLIALCEAYGLPVVEDAAESLGSKIGDQHTGTFGLMGVLSFNGNKIITTGGGGAILTNDPELARQAKHLSTTAKVPHAWEYIHDQTGFNYRMPNINAAMGCAQLERMDEFLENKRSLVETYQQALKNLPEVHVVTEPVYASSNYWLNAIRIKTSEAVQVRDEILAAGAHAGIMLRPVWKLLSSLVMYQACPRMDLTVAVAIESSCINLPSSSSLMKRA